jgi:hypothetical protein
MSNRNQLSSPHQRAKAGSDIGEGVQALVRCILWVSLAAIFLVLVAPQTASAADVAVTGYHTKAHHHFKRIAYYGGCRIGWWQAYCDGMRRPRWGTRCH